jgi:hypothetical protein
MASERDIQNEIRLALSEKYDLMRNNVGKIMVDGRALKYGLCVGSADLIGLRRRDGRFVAIEVKTSVGKLSPEQRAFIARINASGGIAICARSAKDALEQLKEK